MDAEKKARLEDMEQSLRWFSERINIPPLDVPMITKMYQHNGETYECYDVHTEAAYGNGMLTVTATHRRIEDNGETD